MEKQDLTIRKHRTGQESEQIVQETGIAKTAIKTTMLRLGKKGVAKNFSRGGINPENVTDLKPAT